MSGLYKKMTKKVLMLESDAPEVQRETGNTDVFSGSVKENTVID